MDKIYFVLGVKSGGDHKSARTSDNW